MPARDGDDEPVVPTWLVVWGLCVAVLLLVPDRVLMPLVPERPAVGDAGLPPEALAAFDDGWRMLWLAGIRYGGLGLALLWLPLQWWVERLRRRPEWPGEGTRAGGPGRDEARPGGAARRGLGIVAAACAAFLAACSGSPEGPGAIGGLPPAPVVPEAGASPVVVIWSSAGMNFEVPPASLELAAWSDGRVVWAAGDGQGGRRLLEGATEPPRIASLLQLARQAGVFEEPGFRRSWWGPDSAFESILLRDTGATAVLETWHEIHERNPRLVAAPGLRALAPGETRADALAGCSAEYLRFRAVWAELRAAAAALIPTEGRPSAVADDHRAWRAWRKP